MVFNEYFFDNHHIDISDKVAIAMGTNFIFATTDIDSKPKVKDTFDDKKNADDRVRVFLRISMRLVPPAAITEEVRAALKHWTDPIKNNIIKNYFKDGDHVAATKVAGVLYDYGNTNVLFKQTRAEAVQFRSMAVDAMVYYVESNAENSDYSEDSRFGAEIVFNNCQID
eukprot:4735060-Amphidinium_carterae.1